MSAMMVGDWFIDSSIKYAIQEYTGEGLPVHVAMVNVGYGVSEEKGLANATEIVKAHNAKNRFISNDSKE